jgi:predicted dehydrogenase
LSRSCFERRLLMLEKVRIGFIGSGGIAQAHAKALSAMPDVEIAAFCDIDASRAQAKASEFGGTAFTDFRQMYDAAKPDAVFICLRPGEHGEPELEAAKRGIPFFIEKPVGNNPEVLKRIETAVREANLLTSVGYMNRYRRGIQRAKEIFAEDAPVTLHGGWIGGTPRGGGWWVTKSISGGQLLEQTTHTVDLVRFLCGEPTEVFAYATTAFNKHIEGYSIEDASICSMRLQRGGVATLLSACACNVGGGVWLTVWSQNAKAEFWGWEHSARIQVKDKEPEEIPGEGDIFAIEDRVFVDAVKTGDRSKILCTYEDGVKTALVTIAANESMVTGKAVPVRT